MSKIQKVYYLCRIERNGAKHVPHIRLAGEWLRQAGFATGDKISITTNPDGSITIKKEVA